MLARCRPQCPAGCGAAALVRDHFTRLHRAAASLHREADGDAGQAATLPVRRAHLERQRERGAHDPALTIATEDLERIRGGARRIAAGAGEREGEKQRHRRPQDRRAPHRNVSRKT